MERLTYFDNGHWRLKWKGCEYSAEWVDRIAAYENTGLEPEEVEVQSIAVAQCKPYMDALCDEQGKISINPVRLRKLVQAEKDGRLVALPCKVIDAIDKLFSHNEVIALWYDKPDDKDHSYLLWRREAWRLPDKYKDQRILKIKGIIPERISEADTLNLQVTPYILTREEAEAALKEKGEPT